MPVSDEATARLPRAVCAQLRRADGRYLLVRRADGILGGGHWCPVTGRPNATETLREAIEREVYEEVGLRVRAGDEVYRCLTSDESHLLVWFSCAPEDEGKARGPHRLQEAEVAEARWLSAAQAAELRPTFLQTARRFRDLADGH